MERKHNKSLSLRIYLAEHQNKKKGGSAQHCTYSEHNNSKAVWALLLCITFKEAAYMIGCLWCDYVTGFAANIKY